jgi:RNA polymerase sigma factor FliA
MRSKTAGRDGLIPFDRQQLIADHLFVVRIQAASIHRRLPAAARLNIEFEELLSTGNVGLIEAANRYDGKRRFATFANHRVRGAMFDYIRTLDTCTRAERQREKRGEDSAPYRIRMSLDVARSDGSMFEPSSLLDRRVELEKNVIMKVDVDALIKELPARHARAVRLYFFEDVKMAAIGKRLRVHESRVSQMIKWAIERMREATVAA